MAIHSYAFSLNQRVFNLSNESNRATIFNSTKQTSQQKTLHIKANHDSVTSQVTQMEPHSLILNSTNQTSLQLKPIEAQISVPVTPNFELKLEEDDETYSLVHIAVQFVD